MPLAEGASFCPTCGTFADPRVETAVTRVAHEIVGNDPNARTHYDRIMQMLPAAGAQHFRQRTKGIIDELRAGSTFAPAAPRAEKPRRAPVARSNAPLAPKGTGRRKHIAATYTLPKDVLDAKPVTMQLRLLTTPSQREIVPIRVQFSRSTTVSSSGSRVVETQNGFLFRFNELPANVTAAFQQVSVPLAARAQQSTRLDKIGGWAKGWGFMLLFFAIFLGLFTESLVIGGSLAAVGVVLLAAAFIYFKPVSRQTRITGDGFVLKLVLATKVIETIRQDMRPNRAIRGWLDMSGSINENYVHSTGRSFQSGRPKTRYRHDWFHLHTRLLDGTRLRVWITEDCKQRMSFYKKGSISGKMKLKPGSAAYAQRLRVALGFDPARYQPVGIAPANAGSKVPGSAMTIRSVEVTGNRVEVEAAGVGQDIGQGDVKAVLGYARSLMQRR
jgi:hypothetical protein